MDTRPESGTHECPYCGVDAARAYVVAGVVAFYKPWFSCPRCERMVHSLQDAADHMATHEPDVVEFVRAWIAQHGAGFEVRRRRE